MEFSKVNIEKSVMQGKHPALFFDLTLDIKID
jgi:hypothetical protein